jgi:hypothetical protein
MTTGADGADCCHLVISCPQFEVRRGWTSIVKGSGVGMARVVHITVEASGPHRCQPRRNKLAGDTPQTKGVSRSTPEQWYATHL